MNLQPAIAGDPMARVLVVDDDRDFAESARELAADYGCEVVPAPTLADARSKLSERMDLIILDLDLPDGSGLDLLEDIDAAQHGRIVILTGHPSLETARRAVSKPVLEYLLKPLPPDDLAAMFQDAAVTALEMRKRQARAGMLGMSHAFRSATEVLFKVAPTDVSVLLTGESGTGKELAARTLHEASGRMGAFVAINCGAVPSELLASQLFGHERGSFTGATGRHIGVFEQAESGTLFLDEITEMPPSLQVYLLRALETGSITRVGGLETIRTSARIVAATNRSPMEAIAEGCLREDLYYRLADITVHMPPLRERGDDALLLARAFVDRLNGKYGLGKTLSPDSEKKIRRHLWPGNVRELRSCVQRAYLLGNGAHVLVNPVTTTSANALRETDTSIVFNVGMTLSEMEHCMLMKTLAHFGNDKTATAKALGISVRTVHNHLAKMCNE